MNCSCGHTDIAHKYNKPPGACRLCECTSYEHESEVIYTEEDKKEWTKIKKMVGLKKK